MPLKILISAGEASGDWYASRLAAAIKERHPDATFFGCTGPKMRQAGIQTVVDSSSLSVVGLVEVLPHIPRIYGEFRKLKVAIAAEKPDLAILTDSPGFHLKLLPSLKKAGVPVVYLIAPQVWAWRQWRLKTLKAHIDRLLCIFPFEEDFFRRNGVNATYIGHPLAHSIRPILTKDEFFTKHNLPKDRPLVAILPGSRPGEAGRHLASLAESVEILRSKLPCTFVAGTPSAFSQRAPLDFWKPFSAHSIQVLEGHTWDLLAHSDLALAASGTVTVEAALLGCPMVTFYRVTKVSWMIGKWLVRVPYFSMVNLVAGKAIVPELIQDDMTGPRLATEAERLLTEPDARATMKNELARVTTLLKSNEDPMQKSLGIIDSLLKIPIQDTLTGRK